jgi:hypothetical protein
VGRLGRRELCGTSSGQIVGTLRCQGMPSNRSTAVVPTAATTTTGKGIRRIASTAPVGEHVVGDSDHQRRRELVRDDVGVAQGLEVVVVGDPQLRGDSARGSRPVEGDAG